MISSFGDKKTAALAGGVRVARFVFIEQPARRKLRQLESATTLEDLRVPPGNQLEKLSGDRDGFYCIRINDQWRICFRWMDRSAHDVQIVDYH